ncbi:hypothetical protein NE619_09765 [Anaerovorax odorimutans]|uniref:Sulfurtransferase TusA family protein n=1 Tax=Anaerovorax odorimutans TaxID=109327 RepID=A0ABT1RPA1_9FIRM|nr:DUF6711 family protein [Anaerovorax odorimutans]MCQ4637017.1 hypothetical protein [Anaerovorax odorimutans]
MKLLKLDGYACPSPTAYKVALQAIDAESTGRNEKGIMSREMVRGEVHKIDVSWTNLTTEQAANILIKVKQESVTVAFFEGETETAKMYAGDRDLTLKSITGGKATWDLSFSLIEF